MPKTKKVDKRVVNFSYWEQGQFFAPANVLIIGSGIVGLTSAIFAKRQSPKSRVIIIERGILPSGASTKNAGFACFGSVGEILDDLSKMPESTVLDTLRLRWEGLALLRQTVGDVNMDYCAYGGYEVFTTTKAFERCEAGLLHLNLLLQTVIGKSKTYQTQTHAIEQFGFKGVKGLIKNTYEGQLDTGKMMATLISMAQHLGVLILNGIDVDAITDVGSKVILSTSVGELEGAKVVVATNGFAKQLLKLKMVEPARAQVLITDPIPKLQLKGSFHLDEGYYYFRNIDGRVLLGGGRNLDFEGETTFEMTTTPTIQTALEKLLHKTILPYAQPQIAMRWAGIMGVGTEKKPIVEWVSPRVIAAVRMGGMGVAIGSKVGQQVASLLK